MSFGLQSQRCEWTSLVGTVLFAQGLGRMSTRGRTPQCIVGDRRHDGGWSSSRNYYGNIWVYSGMYVSTDSSSSSSSRGSRRRGVQQRWIVKKVKNQETQQRQAKHASKDRSNQDR